MIDSVEISRRFYDRLGASRLAARTEPEWDSQIVLLVKELLKPGQRVLDVGCGYGRIAIPLALDGFGVVGIDVSEALLEAARVRAAAQGAILTWRNEHMCQMSLPDGDFDVALCLWSAFYELLTREEQISSIRELHRVLRTDGWALLEGPVYQEPTS